MKNKLAINEAEKVILSGVLTNSKVVPEVLESLSVNDFTNEKHRFIYQSISNVYNERKSINISTVIKDLEANEFVNQAGGSNYLNELTSLYYNREVSDMVELLYENAKQRELLNMISEFMNVETHSDYEADLNSLKTKILNIDFNLHKDDIFNVGEVATESEKDFLFYLEHPDFNPNISTGFDKLDEKIGILRTQQLVFVGARPSMGKTAFSIQLAIMMAKNFYKRKENEAVCLFSIEMSRKQIINRMIANIANIELSKVNITNQRKELTIGDKQSHEKGVKILNGMRNNFFIIDKSGITLNQMRSYLIKLKRESNVKVVVIDYLQIIGHSTVKDDEVLAISRLCDGLKHLARELDLLIICLSQLSRDVEKRSNNKRPMLSDLKGSGSAEANADIVMMLYRDDYYRDKEFESDNDDVSELEVIITKNREGQCGTVYFDYFKSFQSFVEK